MKKIKIISIIAILVILMLQAMCTICSAEELKIDTSKYRPTGIEGYSKAESKAQKIVEVLRTVGIAVAVIGMLVLGIKYMLGSVEERAVYKKSMQPYLIGCILLFTITTIATIIYDIANAINSGA